MALVLDQYGLVKQRKSDPAIYFTQNGCGSAVRVRAVGMVRPLPQAWRDELVVGRKKGTQSTISIL